MKILRCKSSIVVINIIDISRYMYISLFPSYKFQQIYLDFIVLELKLTLIGSLVGCEYREQQIKTPGTTHVGLVTMHLTFLGEESKSMWLTVILIQYFSNISEALINISIFTQPLLIMRKFHF